MKYIKYSCLIFSEKYIQEHYSEVLENASAIEFRDEEELEYCTKEMLVRENLINLKKCRESNCNYILIDDKYDVDIKL